MLQYGISYRYALEAFLIWRWLGRMPYHNIPLLHNIACMIIYKWDKLMFLGKNARIRPLMTTSTISTYYLQVFRFRYGWQGQLRQLCFLHFFKNYPVRSYGNRWLSLLNLIWSVVVLPAFLLLLPFSNLSLPFTKRMFRMTLFSIHISFLM